MAFLSIYFNNIIITPLRMLLISTHLVANLSILHQKENIFDEYVFYLSV